MRSVTYKRGIAIVPVSSATYIHGSINHSRGDNRRSLRRGSGRSTLKTGSKWGLSSSGVPLYKCKFSAPVPTTSWSRASGVWQWIEYSAGGFALQRGASSFRNQSIMNLHEVLSCSGWSADRQCGQFIRSSRMRSQRCSSAVHFPVPSGEGLRTSINECCRHIFRLVVAVRTTIPEGIPLGR